MSTSVKYFKDLLEGKDTVDDIIQYHFKKEKKYTFSEMFPLLFDNLTTEESKKGRKNILSYFEHLCGSFDWDLKKCNQKQNDAAGQICDNFRIERNSPLHQLLAFLCKVYEKTTLDEGVRGEIFRFMTDFRIKNARVVFMLHQPSGKYEACGRALHEAKALTTWRVLDHLNEELKLIDSFGKSDCKLELSQETLRVHKNNCNLKGWINQGVLLMNSKLTYKDEIWEHFTSTIIDGIDIIDGISNLEHKVFLLAGQSARKNARRINKDVNLALEVHHPTAKDRLQNKYKWKNALPFTNSNFFLYQKYKKGGHLTDWSCISGDEYVESERIGAIVAFFDYLLNELKNHNKYGNQVVSLYAVKSSYGFWQLERKYTT